ncbi:hypothetical protein QTG54_002335, partial [Skeletonema marinoi]
HSSIELLINFHKQQSAHISTFNYNKRSNYTTMSLSLWNTNSPFGGFDDDFFSGSPVFGIPALTAFKNDNLLHSSPRYEVSENSKQFRLAVDVPGVKANDIKVDLERDGRVLHMTGHRRLKRRTRSKSAS